MKKHLLVISAIVTLLLLAACTDAIKLRNSQTGQIAQCGPYASDMLGNGAVNVLREEQCIRGFQRQSSERIP